MNGKNILNLCRDDYDSRLTADSLEYIKDNSEKKTSELCYEVPLSYNEAEELIVFYSYGRIIKSNESPVNIDFYINEIVDIYDIDENNIRKLPELLEDCDELSDIKEIIDINDRKYLSILFGYYS